MSKLGFFLGKIFPARHRFKTLESNIGYRFKNVNYLTQAFTHRSIDPEPRKNYERLEFLGDAVIDIIISRALMREYPVGDEGLLTQKRAALVQKSFLANMGNLINILDYLIIDPTVNMSVEKIADRQSANCMEALVGAMYLDGGIRPCRKFVLDTIWRHRSEAWKSTNYKGRLIEFCHSQSIANPRFIVSNVSGPEHQKMFEVLVKIGSDSYQPGIGSNKKAAEQAAAQNALDSLQRQYS
ncbi:MAG: ribonuclease III [Fidelibacterota bacterium]